MSATPHADRWEAEGKLSDHDAREVRAFERFLQVADPPGRPGMFRHARGWVPYAFGWPPPEGMDDVPLTAMGLPA